MAKFSLLPKGNSTKNKVSQDNEQKNVINVNVDNVENINLTHNIASNDSDTDIKTMEMPGITPISQINDGDIVEVQANGDAVKLSRSDRKAVKKANNTYFSKQNEAVASVTRAGVYIADFERFLHTLDGFEEFAIIGMVFNTYLAPRILDNGDSWTVKVGVVVENYQDGRDVSFRVNDTFYLNRLMTLVIKEFDGTIRYAQGIIIESTDSKVINVTSGSVMFGSKELPAMIDNNVSMGQIIGKETIPGFTVFPKQSQIEIEFEIPKLDQTEEISVETVVDEIWTPDAKATLLGKIVPSKESKTEIKLVRKNNNPNKVIF